MADTAFPTGFTTPLSLSLSAEIFADDGVHNGWFTLAQVLSLAPAVPAASTAVPAAAAGTGAVGVSTAYARADHAHPASSAAAAPVAPRIITTAGNITVAASDPDWIIVNQTTPAACTVTLEASPAAGQTRIVTDGSNSSGTYALTVKNSAGGTIVTINFNGDSATLRFDGTVWRIT